MAEARLEVRNYYRIRPFDGRNVVQQKHIWNRILSPRRPESHHPTTTYYRGAFVAYNKYSIKFGEEGKQGNAVMGGVMWGMVKPLYEFSNGNTLDLEFGVGVGVALAKYDTYTHDREDDCYPLMGNKSTIMPVVNDLHVGFVYRFGKYPITKKYRWRYDVDLKYQEVYDSVIAARKMEQTQKTFMDSLDAATRKMFWEKYDSIAPHNKARNDSIRAVENALKTVQKKEAEAAKLAEKQAEKERKRQEKEKENPGEETPVAETPQSLPSEQEKLSVQQNQPEQSDRPERSNQPAVEPATPEEGKEGES